MITIEHLADIWDRHKKAGNAPVRSFSLGKHGLKIGQKPLVMGVINLSSQSWYRESVCLNQASAIRRGELLLAQGADIIDIGAESTLPHADRVHIDLQIRSLLPIIKAFVKSSIIVSVETYSAKIAKAALDSGASIINLTGSSESEMIYQMAAASKAAVIISYVEGTHVRDVDRLNLGSEPFIRFENYFKHEIEKAKKHSLEKIILDPGLGFYYRDLEDGSARVSHQVQTLLQSFRLRPFGKPICQALPHAFEFFQTEVRSAETFFSVLAALGKTDLLRTHEVARIRPVLQSLSCDSILSENND